MSLHEKLKEHLVLKLSGERASVLQIELYTCQVPRPPRSRESNDSYEVKRCHVIRSSNRASVLQIELYYSPVKCHHVSLMTRGVLHGKSKEHLVCNLL